MPGIVTPGAPSPLPLPCPSPPRLFPVLVSTLALRLSPPTPKMMAPVLCMGWYRAGRVPLNMRLRLPPVSVPVASPPFVANPLVPPLIMAVTKGERRNVSFTYGLRYTHGREETGSIILFYYTNAYAPRHCAPLCIECEEGVKGEPGKRGQGRGELAPRRCRSPYRHRSTGLGLGRRTRCQNTPPPCTRHSTPAKPHSINKSTPAKPTSQYA